MSHKLIIDVVIEIPKFSSNKYEFNAMTGQMHLDRVLYGANFYPGEYGFVQQTLDFDGDPLDIIVVSTYPTFPGCHVAVKIVGALDMIDNGEGDTKLIGVVANDPRFDQLNDITDLSNHTKLEIKDFFENYKNLQVNSNHVEVGNFLNLAQANTVLVHCQSLFVKYQPLLAQLQHDTLHGIDTTSLRRDLKAALQTEFVKLNN